MSDLPTALVARIHSLQTQPLARTHLGFWRSFRRQGSESIRLFPHCPWRIVALAFSLAVATVHARAQIPSAQSTSALGAILRLALRHVPIDSAARDLGFTLRRRPVVLVGNVARGLDPEVFVRDSALESTALLLADRPTPSQTGWCCTRFEAIRSLAQGYGGDTVWVFTAVAFAKSADGRRGAAYIAVAFDREPPPQLHVIVYFEKSKSGRWTFRRRDVGTL